MADENNDTLLRVLRIVEGTSVDGPGLRTSIYFAGCAHHCPGCHNPQSWPMDGGQPMSIGHIVDVVEYNGYGVTLSGGDPFYQATGVAALARAIRRKCPDVDIWCYTGFTWEQLMEHSEFMPLLQSVDVVVDGPFVQAGRDTQLLFRGSGNQRIIDVPQSLAAGQVALWQGFHDVEVRF